MKHIVPSGLPNSLESRRTPDIQTAFQIFTAHWRRVNDRWRYPTHTHPMFEINVVLEGTQRFIIGEETFIQQEGEILFIRPGIKHHSDGSASEGGMAYFSLHFDTDDLTLRRGLLSVNAIRLEKPSPALSEVRAAIDCLIEIAKNPESDAHKERLITLHASFRLFTALSGWILSEDTNPSAINPSATEKAVALANEIEALLSASLIIDHEADKREGIEEIAERLGYSPTHCNRVFRHVFGVSPRQYLSGLIIRQAKLLLMDNSLSIDKVARKLGYLDVSHFSKQFKRWTGLSPMGYRKLNALESP